MPIIRKEYNHNNIKKNNINNESKNPDILDNIEIPIDTERGFPLLQIQNHYYNFDDLIIKNEIKEKMESIIIENQCRELLTSFGLKPKNKILFCGPPGTGKTLSSKIISSVISFPFVYVMFDSILSSYLGETAKNLRKIFDFIEKGTWVVLFDEFDIIGKRRDDPYEHGEIKRVVNNFIQMIDNFKGNSIIIASTNHHQLLDTAIWRRFEEILFFDLPDLKHRKLLFNKYLSVLKREREYNVTQFAKDTEFFSAYDIAQVCEEALKITVLNSRDNVKYEDINGAIKEQKRRKSVIYEK